MEGFDSSKFCLSNLKISTIKGYSTVYSLLHHYISMNHRDWLACFITDGATGNVVTMRRQDHYNEHFPVSDLTLGWKLPIMFNYV